MSWREQVLLVGLMILVYTLGALMVLTGMVGCSTPRDFAVQPFDKTRKCLGAGRLNSGPSKMGPALPNPDCE